MTKYVCYLNAVELIGCRLPDLAPSRHRSKRLTKKLNKKLSTPHYSPPVVLRVSNAVLPKLEGAYNAARSQLQ